MRFRIHLPSSDKTSEPIRIGPLGIRLLPTGDDSNSSSRCPEPYSHRIHHKNRGG